jgi:hypothetical protein
MLSPLYTWPLLAALHFAPLEMSGLGFGFHGQTSQLAGSSSAKRHSTSTAKLLLLLLQRLRCLMLAEGSFLSSWSVRLIKPATNSATGLLQGALYGLLLWTVCLYWRATMVP